MWVVKGEIALCPYEWLVVADNKEDAIKLVRAGYIDKTIDKASAKKLEADVVRTVENYWYEVY